MQVRWDEAPRPHLITLKQQLLQAGSHLEVWEKLMRWGCGEQVGCREPGSCCEAVGCS